MFYLKYSTYERPGSRQSTNGTLTFFVKLFTNQVVTIHYHAATGLFLY